MLTYSDDEKLINLPYVEMYKNIGKQSKVKHRSDYWNTREIKRLLVIQMK